MIKLYLFNNVRREEIGEVTLETLLPTEDLAEALFRRFEKAGVNVDREKGSLRIKQGGEFLPFDADLVENGEDVTVAYLHVIAPINARQLFRKNGIVYFIGSDERKHVYEPHIHARIGGKDAETIRISLRYFSVEGCFKNRKKETEAIRFVKEHLEEILVEWNCLMESLGEPKWES